MIEALRRAIIGVGIGGLATFVMLTIFKMNAISVTVDELWIHMLGSLILGIYFGVGSLIFEKEDWSPLKQIITHLSLSVIVFFPIALTTGWVSAKPVPILFCLITFLIIYALFWFSIRWYLKKMEASMNESIQ
ncbi:DUF3021 domain-containing protein [Pseudalkalibacillus sp. Hm43]|uniref:DUF3021 domain-containing protein n=1 Tax=Pseudalkalibacillus sp. Hm43 TaxID=3450742 RepID=UPI003F43240E